LSPDLARDSYLWGATNNKCPQSLCRYSLSDFFNFNATAAGFTPISAPYGPSTFRDWIENGNPASPPDGDDVESPQ